MVGDRQKRQMHGINEEKRTLIDCAGLLADIISQAGEALDAYIQSHSEVPHVEVLEHVSSILKDYGFVPTEGIDVGNLHPYDCKMEDKELRVTHGWDLFLKVGKFHSFSTRSLHTSRGCECSYRNALFMCCKGCEKEST